MITRVDMFQDNKDEYNNILSSNLNWTPEPNKIRRFRYFFILFLSWVFSEPMENAGKKKKHRNGKNKQIIETKKCETKI